MKMGKPKSVRFQETIDVYVPTSSSVSDIEEDSYLAELALHLAQRAISAAVDTVKEKKRTLRNIKWITHGEFTAERGRRQIEKFVLTWGCRGHWAHYTKFVEKKDMVHSFYYIYLVRWSIPTSNIPMALGSSAVYFTIKINKNKPPEAPVDVSYIFEGQSLVYRPGTSYFREQLQSDFVEAKDIVMASIPF